MILGQVHLKTVSNSAVPYVIQTPVLQSAGVATPVRHDVRLFLPLNQPRASIGCIVCSWTQDDKVSVSRSRADWHGEENEENRLQVGSEVG